MLLLLWFELCSGLNRLLMETCAQLPWWPVLCPTNSVFQLLYECFFISIHYFIYSLLKAAARCGWWEKNREIKGYGNNSFPHSHIVLIYSNRTSIDLMLRLCDHSEEVKPSEFKPTTFSQELKSVFKLQRNNKVTFILIIIDIAWNNMFIHI